MAGRPKVKADTAIIQLRLAEIEEMLSQGQSQSAVMETLGIGRRAWYDWCGTPDGAALTSRARTRAATALAEQTLQIADTATAEEERVARLRIDTRRWIAKAWSPGEYGDRIQADVRVADVTAMHAQALRDIVLRATAVGNNEGNSEAAVALLPAASGTYDADQTDTASAAPPLAAEAPPSQSGGGERKRTARRSPKSGTKKA